MALANLSTSYIRRILIFTDNQYALRSISRPGKTSGQKIIQDFWRLSKSSERAVLRPSFTGSKLIRQQKNQLAGVPKLRGTVDKSK